MQSDLWTVYKKNQHLFSYFFLQSSSARFVQCSCENARLCSLVWVFVARIHVISGVNALIDPFNPNGISRSFQLDKSITVLG